MNNRQKELCFSSTAHLLKQFQTGKLSPVEVLEAQIARIVEFDTTIHAFSTTHFAEARIQAEASEARYKAGNPLPLDGITCAIKDEIDVKGWTTKMGSLIYADKAPAEEDAPLTRLLRAAGLVFIGQTTVPDHYCNLVTWNKSQICRNPWNLEYTPGGSSGGSAAALAAGFTSLATGSDMGGSIRFPAAMCGLYGFKPPYGRVATSATQYESEGPLARTMEDLIRFQNAICGPSPYVPSSLKPKLNYPLEYATIKGLRIAYAPMSTWGAPFTLDPTVKYALDAAVNMFRTLGALVEEVDLNLKADDFETYARGLFSTSLGAFCFEKPEEHRELNTPYLQALIDKYGKIDSTKNQVIAENWAAAHHTEIQEKIFLQGFSAIIMPTMCSPYIKANMGSTPENNCITIDGKPVPANTWQYAFTWPWNILGQYPVLNVPIGMTSEKLPLGMQIIANTFEDLTAFQVATAFAKASPIFFEAENPPKLVPEDQGTINKIAL